MSATFATPRRRRRTVTGAFHHSRETTYRGRSRQVRCGSLRFAPVEAAPGGTTPWIRRLPIKTAHRARSWGDQRWACGVGRPAPRWGKLCTDLPTPRKREHAIEEDLDPTNTSWHDSMVRKVRAPSGARHPQASHDSRRAVSRSGRSRAGNRATHGKTEAETEAYWPCHLSSSSQQREPYPLRRLEHVRPYVLSRRHHARVRLHAALGH